MIIVSLKPALILCIIIVSLKSALMKVPQKLPGENTNTGALVSVNETLADCLDNCIGSCQAVDYSTTTKTCYIHGVASACNTPSNTAGFMHYRKFKCGTYGECFVNCPIKMYKM